MNLKLLLCDDSDLQLKKTTNFVHSCLDTYTSFTSMIVPYKPEELEKLLETDTGNYDIAILDIEMGNFNGIDFASKLNQCCPQCAVIFLTSHTDYISESYEVRHIYYVTKDSYRNICLRLWIKRFSLQLNERHAFWTLSQTGNDTLFHATRLPISNGSAGRSLFIPTMGKPIKYTNPFRL